ncbi:MAG: stage IV sporulation protein A [Agathobacter sp.]|nr:stage IV sporulation protein A [Agathobacter sp.]
MSGRENKEFDLYKDIQGRTNGEIYIGVVGPVRTGKSTFIKRFMDLFVLPYIDDENVKRRTMDELPQSSAGKTIMTTEPKFIPQEAARITLADNSDIQVRLIDCVGFMVEGANGHMEEGGDRMVKTPWFDEEIPFVDAARTGTRKVIHDHATIGIVVTTDGTVGELPRESYLEPEQTTVEELKEIGKPFVVVLNTAKPYSEETRRLADHMSATYGAVVIPVNCQQMRSEDVTNIMNAILLEFPITRIDFFIPKWTEMLPVSHPVKAAIVDAASGILAQVEKAKDVYALTDDGALTSMANEKAGQAYFREILIPNVNLSVGTVNVRMQIDDKYYFAYISEMTGVSISGEYQMISMLRGLAAMKEEYEKVKDAMMSVEQKGYGVVMPGLSDIKMEDPVMIQHGGKFGVKMRALSPSIHMIKANIETEIAPIVGSEEQARDLIEYIKAGEESGEGLWTTNIFGKSVGELMEDGIRSKILKMDDECQLKLQDTMQKIVNDSNGGLICIII